MVDGLEAFTADHLNPSVALRDLEALEGESEQRREDLTTKTLTGGSERRERKMGRWGGGEEGRWEGRQVGRWWRDGSLEIATEDRNRKSLGAKGR